MASAFQIQLVLQPSVHTNRTSAEVSAEAASSQTSSYTGRHTELNVKHQTTMLKHSQSKTLTSRSSHVAPFTCCSRQRVTRCVSGFANRQWTAPDSFVWFLLCGCLPVPWMLLLWLSRVHAQTSHLDRTSRCTYVRVSAALPDTSAVDKVRWTTARSSGSLLCFPLSA